MLAPCARGGALLPLGAAAAVVACLAFVHVAPAVAAEEGALTIKEAHQLKVIPLSPTHRVRCLSGHVRAYRHSGMPRDQVGSGVWSTLRLARAQPGTATRAEDSGRRLHDQPRACCTHTLPLPPCVRCNPTLPRVLHTAPYDTCPCTAQRVSYATCTQVVMQEMVDREKMKDLLYK